MQSPITPFELTVADPRVQGFLFPYFPPATDPMAPLAAVVSPLPLPVGHGRLPPRPSEEHWESSGRETLTDSVHINV